VQREGRQYIDGHELPCPLNLALFTSEINERMIVEYEPPWTPITPNEAHPPRQAPALPSRSRSIDDLEDPGGTVKAWIAHLRSHGGRTTTWICSGSVAREAE